MVQVPTSRNFPCCHGNDIHDSSLLIGIKLPWLFRGPRDPLSSQQGHRASRKLPMALFIALMTVEFTLRLCYSHLALSLWVSPNHWSRSVVLRFIKGCIFSLVQVWKSLPPPPKKKPHLCCFNRLWRWCQRVTGNNKKFATTSLVINITLPTGEVINRIRWSVRAERHSR